MAILQKKRKKKRRKKKRLPVRPAELRKLALAGMNMATAEATILRSVELPTSLAELIAKYTELDEAWNRGKMLYRLKSLAIALTPKKDAAETLDISLDDFEHNLEADREFSDTWNSGLVSGTVAFRAGLAKAAARGNARACDQILSGVRKGMGTGHVDPLRLSVEQTAELTGVSRQTLHTWKAKLGAPCNVDGSFNLPKLFEWRIDHEGARLGAKDGKGGARVDIEQERLRRLRRENDLEEGKFVPLDQVIVTLISLESALIAVLDNQPQTFAQTLAGLKSTEIATAVERYNADARARIKDARMKRDPIPQMHAPACGKFINELLHGGKR